MQLIQRVIDEVQLRDLTLWGIGPSVGKVTNPIYVVDSESVRWGVINSEK